MNYYPTSHFAFKFILMHVVFCRCIGYVPELSHWALSDGGLIRAHVDYVNASDQCAASISVPPVSVILPVSQSVSNFLSQKIILFICLLCGDRPLFFPQWR